MLEQKGILIHEISLKSLSTPQQPTSNPPLFPPPKKKKRTKQTSSTDHQTFQSPSLPVSKLAFLSAAVKRATGTKRKRERK